MKEDGLTSKVLTLNVARTIRNKEGKATLHALSMPLPTELNVNAAISKENKKKLISLFQLLHPLLVISSKREFKNQYDSIASDFESGNRLFNAASVDSTCLFKCIYSLSTGKFPPDTSQIINIQSTQQKNLLVQIFGIAEMIQSQSVWNEGKNILKEFVSQQLMVNCAPTALYQVLNQIGISRSNQTVRVEAIKDSKNKILEGYLLAGKKYDLFLILFDNLGFRIRGGKNLKVGYDQYTALELVNVPKSSLIEWGVIDAIKALVLALGQYTLFKIYYCEL